MSTSIDKLSDPASVVAWLDSHEFDERSKQVLAGFTAHDLKSLTREDAKELLGAATGIRLFNRVNHSKSRSSSSSSSLSLRSLVEEATDKLSLHDRTTSSEEQNSSDEDDSSSPHTLASTTDDSRYSSRSPSRSPHPEFGQSKKKKKNSVLLSPLQVSAVARLAAYYPRQTRLNVHMSSSSHGKRLDCCSSALASLRASVAATESTHGISGSLAWLTRAFQWGSSRCEYLCECIMSCSSLDCGAGASLAVRLLRECSETKGENATISIVGVQLILRHSEQEYKRWNDLWKREDLLRAKDARWLDESGVHLHQAVGIITLATNEMAVWNYGTWIRASNDLNAKAAPLAIRVDPFNDLVNESPEDDPHVTRVIPSSVIFGGFAINVDEWTSLMPPDTAVSGLPSAVKVPILSSCSSSYTSLLSSSSSLLNVSEPSSPLSPISSSVVCPASSEVLPSIRSRVFVSGCAMNDDNPSPGIGVSRSIRSRFPHSRITGVDFSVESAGLADPVLDDIVVIDAWSVSKPAAHYLDVESFLQQDSNSYWIPCSDVEVHLLAHQAKKNHSSKDIRSRILCPGIGALKAILKPCVDAGDMLGMKVPKFFSVDDDTSVQEVYAWCMSMSYPVYVKGVHFGAQLCHTWQSAASAVYYLKKDLRQPVFIQRAESGWQKGLAFAAVEGQLTGALMLTKTVTTLLEKGWSGHLGAVPADLLERVSAFVKKTNWTGGGEIEFLEALDGNRWLIDFNPRFPAWIGASTLVNVNLPGAFLQHVMSFRASRFESDCGGISMNVPMPSDIAVNAAIADAYYTRTVVEQISTRCAPVITSGPDAATHLPCGGAPRQHASRFAVAAGLVHAPDENHDDDDDDDDDTRGHHKTPDEAEKKSVLIAASSFSSPKKNVSDAGLLCQPRGISSFSALHPRLSTVPSSFPSSPSSFSSSMCDPSTLHADLDRVCPRVSELYSLKTPCYILSESGVDACVSSCRKALECACAIAGIRNCSISASIKTNPHQKVLERARIGGAHAEGISIAEIRAALNAGFPLSECVLNGPAKFVDARNDKLLGDTDIFFSKEKREAMRAIFADNIEDLAYILTLIKNPDHWLKARTVGVRFSPSHSTLFSRFGVRQDAVSLRRTAELLKTLPQHIAIGIHFHFAASALGLGGWIAQARALLQVAKQLQDLTQRPIQVLDLGGGWPARMLEDSNTIQSIASVLKEALILMPAIEEVYLEPGKALTERAGALLSTVTGLREVAMSQELSSSSVLTHVPYASIRAAVLDSCICDVGALVAHPHPCLHLDDATQEWKLMGVGKDEVLGRICMEWDKLAIGVQLPYNMKPGDKVLLAFAGAYDISMGYGFGYGMLPDINTDVHWLP